MAASSSSSHSQKEDQESDPSKQATWPQSNNHIYKPMPGQRFLSSDRMASHAFPSFNDLDSFLDVVSRIELQMGRNRNLTKNDPNIIWLHGSMCREIGSAYAQNVRPKLSEIFKQCTREFMISPTELFAALRPSLDNLVAVMIEAERFVELCKCERNKIWDHEIVWLQKALGTGLSTDPADTHLQNLLLAMSALGDAIIRAVSAANSESAKSFITQRFQQGPVDQFWNQEAGARDPTRILLSGVRLDRARKEDISQLTSDQWRITSNPACQGDNFKQELVRLLRAKISDHEMHHPADGNTVSQHSLGVIDAPETSSRVSYPALADSFYADFREVEILQKIHPPPGSSDINMRMIVEVYEVLWRPAGPNKKFAMKRFWGGAQNCFALEAQIHLQLHHPNIIQCFCAFRGEDGRSSSLLMELMDKNLSQNIEARATASLTLREQIHIMLEIAKGMKYLHSRGIIHRDLKPENVLIKTSSAVRHHDNELPIATATLFSPNLYEMQIKVADFSIARPISEPTRPDKAFTKQVGTSIYRAPEVMGDEQTEYGTSVDVFSFAMVCFKILSGSEVFEGEIHRVTMVCNGKRPDLSVELDGKCPPYLQRCIEAWWDAEPEKRPTFKEICRVLRHLHAVVMQCNGPGLSNMVGRQGLDLPAFLRVRVDKNIWSHVQEKARLEMQRFDEEKKSLIIGGEDFVCSHSSANEVTFEMLVMKYAELALHRHIQSMSADTLRSSAADPTLIIINNNTNENSNESEDSGCFKSCFSFCMSKSPLV